MPEHPAGDAGPTTAWTLVQLAALLRQADDLLLEGLRMLGPGVHAGFAEDASLELDGDRLVGLQATLAVLADLADQLRVLGECLPAESVEIHYDDLRRGAADDLAAGIAEPSRAQLAARALPFADGWRALAEALVSADAHADWHELTPGQLLRRFRGANRQLVRSALDDAGLDEDTPFADCDPERLDALAAVLTEYAAGPR